MERARQEIDKAWDGGWSARDFGGPGKESHKRIWWWKCMEMPKRFGNYWLYYKCVYMVS